MRTMNTEEIVLKLTGPVNPVGETQTDDGRFFNLEDLCSLVNQWVRIIDRVACENKERSEFSRQRAGKYANHFLTETLGIKE